jgi:hypothetical protein
MFSVPRKGSCESPAFSSLTSAHLFVCELNVQFSGMDMLTPLSMEAVLTSGVALPAMPHDGE